MTTKIDCCGTCMFFEEHSSKQHGFCKFEPPVFTGNRDGFARFFNPVVSPNSFCSKYEPDE